jgi:hypothetical protein
VFNGQLNLRDVETVTIPGSGRNKELILIIVTEKRKMQLEAEDQTVRDKWVAALNMAAQARQGQRRGMFIFHCALC